MRRVCCVLIILSAFARLSSAAGAEIRVDAGRLEQRVSPELFGNSVMFDGDTMGYDWWVTDQRGYDKAKAQWDSYLPYISELHPTVLRYPSGLGANNFYWKAGIGPITGRPPDYDYGYPQVFGTDEFLQYCEELGAEAIMVVNVSTAGKRPGTVQDAADWVEYCNAPADGSNPGGGTDWAAVRAANGHREPYHVRYWELGNEVLYPGKEDYARRVREYSEAMKAIDPTVKIGVICSGGGIDPVFETRTWLDYQAYLLEHGGDSFDFWIQHSHMPAASGTIVRGFMMVQDGASVSMGFAMDKGGNYRVRIPVEGRCYPFCPELRLAVDGQLVGRWKVNPGASVLESPWFDLGPGAHTLRLEAGLPTSQARLTVQQQIEFVSEEDGKSLWVDLKNSREIYHAILGGWALADWAFLQGEPYRGDKPVFYTELNTQYNVDKAPPFLGRAGSVREMLATGCLYNIMLRRGVQLANYWLLFQESDAIGVLEGVAYDDQTGERGRPDPRRRPVFHLLKAYRENALDWVVQTDVVDAPTFATGWQTGVVMGYAQQDFDLSYVQALGTVSEKGDRLSLFLMNLHPDEAMEVPVRVEGFPRKTGVRVITVTGEEPWTNNEPETCPDGNCVSTEEKVVRFAVSPIRYRIPAHSLTVLVFYREGSDQDPPSRPEGLAGAADREGVLLQWRENREPDLAGYWVYRSRCPAGPFRHRLNAEPVIDASYLDRAVDPRVRYTYAVSAVDQAGNESGFSGRIALAPLPEDGDPDAVTPPDEGPDEVPPSPPVLLEVR